MNNGRQQGFCKIRATEYRLKYIGNSNRLLYLGRINEKVTAKQAAVILMPVLRKAPNVACNAIGHTMLIKINRQDCLDRYPKFPLRWYDDIKDEEGYQFPKVTQNYILTVS